MKDYQALLDRYNNFPEHRQAAEQYLEKYWLDKKELTQEWLEIKNRIFNKDFHSLPDRHINENYNVIILKGGIVFFKEEFEIYQTCMKIVGDKYFIVLEDYDENKSANTSGHPYRLKFPVNITWEEMISHGDPYLLSSEVFLIPTRNYFVFGDSGMWGKYEGIDYRVPLSIIGVDENYYGLFYDKFRVPNEDVEALKKWTASCGMKLTGYD